MTLLHAWSTALRAQWAAYWERIWHPEQRAEEQRSYREQLITRVQELHARSKAEVRARDARILELSASRRDAEARVHELSAKLEALYEQKMVHSLRVGAELDKLQAELAASCPPAVDTFLGQIEAEIDHWLLVQSIESTVIGRLSALRRAREQAEALRVEPRTAADILTALRRLEKSLPAISPELMHRHLAMLPQGGHYATR